MVEEKTKQFVSVRNEEKKGLEIDLIDKPKRCWYSIHMAAGWRRFANRSPYPEITSSADHSSVVYGPKSDRRYRIEWVRAYYESPPQLYY